MQRNGQNINFKELETPVPMMFGKSLRDLSTPNQDHKIELKKTLTYLKHVAILEFGTSNIPHATLS